MKSLSLLIPIVSLIACGCGSHADEEEAAPTKPPVAFEGTVDPSYLATWKSADGVSTYQLLSDGSYKLDSNIHTTQGQTAKTHSEGQWKLSGGKLLFKDASGTVVPYAATLSGNTLELSLTGSVKAKTVLKK